MKIEFVTIQSQGNFHKIQAFTCWNECIFENFFGEKPTARKRMAFSSLALNSYYFSINFLLNYYQINSYDTTSPI